MIDGKIVNQRLAMAAIMSGARRAELLRPLPLLPSLARLAALLVTALTVSVTATELARDGVAKLAIFVAPTGNAALLESAGTLAEYLGRMSGAEFTVSDAAFESAGILLALADSPPVTERDRADLAGLGGEGYLIHAEGEQVLLLGNTEVAVQHAVFGALESVGCRWLIPSTAWTIVPRTPHLVFVENRIITQPPDFAYRSIWYAYGMGVDPSREVLARDYNLWFKANRLGGLARYKCGHTYPSTVGKHKAEFEAHPEYFAMREDGTRLPFATHASLCYSNPEVAALFTADKLAELRADKIANPYAYTVSMDPNDGSVECCCEPCRALGNGSDQALYLANQVARPLREVFPDGVVTMYVYASHRLPPTKVEAEPNVNVQVAMGFNRTNYSLEELVLLWRERVSAVGIRDYFGVMAWDWGLPGRGRASSLAYMRDWIPRFKAWNATSVNAEINANWGTFGPATYVATKMLWDADTDPEAAYKDYFSMAFGNAAMAMMALHETWADSTQLTRQNLHDWFARLATAFAAAEDDAAGVKARLTDMAAYLHYVRLFADWQRAQGAGDRERGYAALRPLLEFTWRTRERQVVHAYALQRRLVNSGDRLIRPLAEGWRFNDPDAVWKHPEPLTDEELMAIFRADLAATPPDTRLRHFSAELEPLTVAGDDGGELSGALRRRTVWHVLVEQDQHLTFDLPVSGVRFDYKLEVRTADGKAVWQSGHRVKTGERYERHDFVLPVRFPAFGLYRLIVTAGEDYLPRFPAGLRVALEASQENHPVFRMFGDAYFYVPAGTEHILAKTNSRLSLKAPSWPGRRDFTAADEDETTGCLLIPVGDDAGKVWTLVNHTAGEGYFLNIPPYVGTDPGALLVPVDAAP